MTTIANTDTTSAPTTLAQRQALAEKTVKWPKGTPKSRRDHNQATMVTALTCIEHGLPVVDVHSIEDGGPCTCQWAIKKNKKQGRPAPKLCDERNWGKHPIGQGWQNGKTTDPDAVEARWGGAFGYLNVGIVFGGDVNIALVDEDGPVGAETTARWRSDPSKGMPDTVTVVSGSGGHHYYYRIPEGWDIRNSSKALAGGIDLRGTNGFSVAPGSRHWSGVATNWADGKGIYRWMEGCSPDDLQIADAPVWMLRKMWFATKSRRHEIAPDGSTWEQADLGDWQSDDDKEPKAKTKPPAKITAPSASFDPFAIALASEGISSEGGWEGRVALIGHGPGLDGFDNPILGAGCSYFGTFGYEADDAPLRAALLERIKDAPENDAGHRDRYLTADYLDGRIQQARDFVKSKDGEAIKVKGQSHGWPAGYESDGEWLCYQRPEGDGKFKRVPMCSLFSIVGCTVDETSQSAFGLLIAFIDKHGKSREIAILDSDVRTDTGGVIYKLSDAGFWIDNTADAKAKFLTLLGRLRSNNVVTVASRAGWHGSTFLTPYGRPLGEDLGMRLADHMKYEGSQDRKGSLDGWRDNAADIVVMIDAHGTVVLCSAFVGPIVDLLKHDTCGIAITGTSSRGKSIAQKFAATVWSDPAPRKGAWVAARGTSNGLEVNAAQATGSTLQIDELKGMKAEQIGEIIMMLSGGVSKIRQDGDQGLQRTLRWNTFFTLSAEESIRELIEGSRGSYVTGYGVRAVEIDTSDAALFDEPSWVDHLKGRLGEHWGHAGPAFVSYLIASGYVEHPARLETRLTEATTWLLDGKPGGGAKGRAAGVLAYAMVAGELAQEAGVIPFEGNDIPTDAGILRRSFRQVWLSSWGTEEGTPENSPETAWRRLEGRAASEWHLHLHSKDEGAFAKAAAAERHGDGEPKLAKWFFTGTPYRMEIKDKDDNSVTVEYVAMTQEAFRYLTKGCGVKESALLKYARAIGKLLPQGKNAGWNKLPGYKHLDNYRFMVGTFGPSDEAEASSEHAAAVLG
jgi:hypothetical protein